MTGSTPINKPRKISINGQERFLCHLGVGIRRLWYYLGCSEQIKSTFTEWV